MSDEKGAAYFSDDRRYRWALSRCWGDERVPMMMFVGLNPSTADEVTLDPTMRRVVAFAKREGFGGIWMGNLFALRSTDPKLLKVSFSPVGKENDSWLLDMAHWTEQVVFGWGSHGGYLDRSLHVRKLLADYKPVCLGKTKNGQPKHPLYLKADTPLQPI